MPNARGIQPSEDVQHGTPGSRALRRPVLAVRVDFGARSHPGKVRAHNEDNYLITQLGRSLRVIQTSLPESELPGQIEEVAYAMVVADGMGGLAAGERASMLAIRTCVELALKSPKWVMRIDDQEAQQLIGRMREFLLAVDQVLISSAQDEGRLSGMGTTLTCAHSIGADMFIVHVGDSRAYLFRSGRLQQLTRDHTFAQHLADVGAIPPEQVATHASRHVLTNFVGGPSQGVEPEIDVVMLSDGDRILLCSDGLTDMVEDAEITEILGRNPDPVDAARVLVDRALKHGGRDNVTVLVARYTFLDTPGSPGSRATADGTG